jgi:hypothetical protein
LRIADLLAIVDWRLLIGSVRVIDDSIRTTSALALNFTEAYPHGVRIIQNESTIHNEQSSINPQSAILNPQ